ncbi:hypothetical protein AB3U99_05350 [Niallia sp. JL1B1071]
MEVKMGYFSFIRFLESKEMIQKTQILSKPPKIGINAKYAFKKEAGT